MMNEERTEMPLRQSERSVVQIMQIHINVLSFFVDKSNAFDDNRHNGH